MNFKIRGGRSTGNTITNVCAKSSYDRLRIDKALGFVKSDNNKNKTRTQRTKIAMIMAIMVTSVEPPL